MSATHAATSSAVGGSACRCRSWSRTDPMSIETDSRGPPRPSTSSVDPPPMSTTSTGSAARRAGPGPQPGGGPGVDERRLLVARQHLRLHAQATTHALGEDRGVPRVAGRRRGAEAHQHREGPHGCG